MVSAGARAYSGGLGAEPPVESSSRAPCHGVRGRSSPEAEALLVFGCSMETANFATFLKFGNAKCKEIIGYISVIFAKDHGWPRNWVAWSKTGGRAVPPLARA